MPEVDGRGAELDAEEGHDQQEKRQADAEAHVLEGVAPVQISRAATGIITTMPASKPSRNPMTPLPVSLVTSEVVGSATWISIRTPTADDEGEANKTIYVRSTTGASHQRIVVDTMRIAPVNHPFSLVTMHRFRSLVR